MCNIWKPETLPTSHTRGAAGANLEQESNSTGTVQSNKRILCMPKPSQNGSPLLSAHSIQHFWHEQILAQLPPLFRKVTLFNTPYLNMWGFLLPPLASKEWLIPVICNFPAFVVSVLSSVPYLLRVSIWGKLSFILFFFFSPPISCQVNTFWVLTTV